MRLIDADALGIGRCNPDAFPLQNRGYCAGWNGVISLLEQAPTVDAVEVVRCGNCIHWSYEDVNIYGKEYGTCKECLMDTEKDFYCASGERREK